MGLVAIKTVVRIALCASLGLAISSCASQLSFPPPPNSVYSRSGDICRINPAYICENAHWRKRDAFAHDLVEQHAFPGYVFTSQVYGLHQKLLVQVQCQVEGEAGTHPQALQHAQLISGPPLTNKDIDYLRRSGLCEAQ